MPEGLIRFCFPIFRHGSLAGPMVSMFCVIFTQGRFVVLPAIEDADDGHRLGIYIKGDDGTLLVIRDAQAWPHVITLCPTKGKRAQAFAVANDGLGILGRHI